jgi:hypothetical protein
MDPEEMRKAKDKAATKFTGAVEKSRMRGFIPPDQVPSVEEEGRTIESRFRCAFLPFEFECPKNWEDLDKTANPNVRHCSQCKENVYLCSTYEELATHSKARECTAYFVDPGPWDEWESGFITGLRTAPVEEVLAICRRLEDLLEENAAGNSDSSVIIRIARLSALLDLTSQANEFAALYFRSTGEPFPNLPEKHPLLENARRYWSDHHPFLKIPDSSRPKSNRSSEQGSAQ